MTGIGGGGIGGGGSHWHLDRRVPIALVAMILVQTAGVGWWAATTSARLDSVERAVVDRRDERDRLVRVETELVQIRETLTSIDRRLSPRSGGL